MVPEALSVARVAARRAGGGHDVPEHEIRQRHVRLWPIVAEAIPMCDATTCWDNARGDGPTKVAAFFDGVSVYPPPWPGWAPPAFGKRGPPAT